MSERPPRLAELDMPSAAETRVGVALCVTGTTIPLTHTGLLYWEPGEPPRLLHLAFHAIVLDEPIPHPDMELLWSELPLGDDGAAAVAGFCRMVAKRPPRVPYGIVYDGGKLTSDGNAALGEKTIGLTCATHALALLRTFNHDLLALETWTPREDDAKWHEHIVGMLESFRDRHPELLTDAHVRAVADESNCARLRPEEVAAAATLPWPVEFAAAEPRGREARQFLLSGA